MRWSWKRELGEAEGAVPASASRGVDTEALRVFLEQRGVPAEFYDLIASRLEADLPALSGEARKAMLDGVALCYSGQKDFAEQLSGSVRGLKEVERMMGAFSGELSKLDEVLEVLAAYVQRMRSSGSPAEQNRTLH